MKCYNNLILFILIGLLSFFSCDENDNPIGVYPDINRENKIPGDIAKRGPDTDQHPPILHSDEFDAPVPMPLAIYPVGRQHNVLFLYPGCARARGKTTA